MRNINMRMMPIASGSSGNCIYVGSDNTHILIDAGISRKKIEEGDLKSTRLNSSHSGQSRMPSSA